MNAVLSVVEQSGRKRQDAAQGRCKRKNHKRGETKPALCWEDEEVTQNGRTFTVIAWGNNYFVDVIPLTRK